MNLDLSSVRAKLARSQEHAQAIKNELRSWKDRSPYSVITHANAECTRYSVILRINEAAPFQRWTLMFADCLSNLRAALDHLVYAIAVHEAAPNPPADEGKLMFPIADSTANFNDLIMKQRRLGNISDPVRTAIEAVQPYNRPHPDIPPLLSILRNLNNTDKHKLLRLAYGTLATANVGFIGSQIPDGGVWKVIPYSGEIEDGTEVLAMVCDRSAPNMKYDKTIFDVIIAIRYGKRDPAGPEGSDRTDLASLLNLLITDVRQVIYEVAGWVK